MSLSHRVEAEGLRNTQAGRSGSSARSWRTGVVGYVSSALTAVVLAACTEPASRTSTAFDALIDADSEVRAQVVDVEARVEVRSENSTSWEIYPPKHFELDSADAWPLMFRVRDVREPADSTVQLIAIARDSRAAVLAQVRVVTTLGRAKSKGLRVMFETSCLGLMQLCGPGLTCSRGDCVSAELDPSGSTGTTASPARSSDAGRANAPNEMGIAPESDPCDTDGELRCAGFASSQPLRCEGSVWKRQTECSATKRCDTSDSANRGTCQSIAPECMGRKADDPFCDSEEMHVCNADLLASAVKPCSDNERCAPDEDGKAVCSCRPGFVAGLVGCVEAVDCEDNGGCDSLTRCEVRAGARSCTICPPGYTGSGDSGCVPQLSDLSVSSGVLTPAFAPDTLEYRVVVPLLTQQVTLTAHAPDGARIEVNGVAPAADGTWTSSLLTLGDNTVSIVVSSPSGVSGTYRVVVERKGVEDSYLKSRAPSSQQGFGWCLALDGDTLAVCAPQDDSGSKGVNGNPADTSARDSGAVYVFVQRNGAWVQQAYLKPSNTDVQDIFGAAVAISGDTLIVGAIRQSPAELTLANPPSRRGSAYVFTRSGDSWTQSQELKPSSGNIADGFGTSISIQGERMVIGAFADGPGLGRLSGAAYVYERRAGSWSEVQKLMAADPHDQAMFGCSVSLWNDTLAIGAMEDSAAVDRGGVAHVFERQAGSWNETQRIDPKLRQAEFGFAIALRENTLAISAPHVMAPNFPDQAPGEVHVFERKASGFVESAILANPAEERHDCFGYSMALGDDVLVIGAHRESGGTMGLGGDPAKRGLARSGAVFLFARTKDGWKHTDYIKAGNASVDDLFGVSVAFSAEMLVVGAFGESNSAAGINPDPAGDSIDGAGAVYVYR